MDSWPVFPHFKLTTAKSYFERIESHADELPLPALPSAATGPGC
ncbi:MAG: hypothetical protein O2923_04035 [Verrucomicrobia bacterium]|nr:hypothetical protein [Verrucomicrobiota bacterium]